MKIIINPKRNILAAATLALGLSALFFSTNAFATGVQTLEETILFTVDPQSALAKQSPPPSVHLIMEHQQGSKTRNFHLSKSNDYDEMKNLTREHITGNGRVGGYFVDELVKRGKETSETYVLILAGQVYETEEHGKKTYTKKGTWTDNLGRYGTWVDQEQAQHPEKLMAACGGK